MGLAFRHRDYCAEKQAFSLPRSRVEIHPLSASSSAPLQVEESISGSTNLYDPLRAEDGKTNGSLGDIPCEVDAEATSSSDNSFQLYRDERKSFKRILMQKFPISKTVPMSMVTGLSRKGSEGSNDSHNIVNDVKGQPDYVSQLNELKNDVEKAWCSDDKVTSLRLSIKAARLLMDTNAIQLYPTLFLLVTDIMDMLGDLVWNRLKQKAEFADDGLFICSLSDDFQAAEVCFDAKETCNNWFFKISSVCELLPRIYLELAILPCWRFLLNHPEEVLERLVLMIRGIADPLASTYCRLYLAQCAHRLPLHDTRYLITCINDLKVVLTHLMATKEVTRESTKILFNLIEPCIEYTTRCLFKNVKQIEVGNLLVSLGIGISSPIPSRDCSGISIILHHILKELPIVFICFNALQILHLIESIDDCSFDQSLNFKLLGSRLCERISEVNKVHLVVDKVMQVILSYDGLDIYLMLADAYMEIIFDHQKDAVPRAILSGIYERGTKEELDENSMLILQSIIMKILSHFDDIEDILIMDHFTDILDLMSGSPRSLINMYILSMATKKGCIRDPIVIEFLLQVAKVLYDDIDFLYLKLDEYHHKTRVISRFISMVDFGMEVESQLQFFSQCREAFASMFELQEMIIHASNNLAVKTMRDVNCSPSFIKSCITFSEVTIPSIHTSSRQLNLFIETTEVALLGGFVSHSHELLIAALNCLGDIPPVSQMLDDVDWTISLICKLCGVMLMVPGTMEQGMTYIPTHLLSYLNSLSWILPRMKVKVVCTILFLLAASSQKPFLYQATSPEVMSNDRLFFDVPAYYQELLLLSSAILENVVNTVLQEASLAIRGKIALETLYCIASSLEATEETSKACSKLVEISRSCTSTDDKFLQFVLKFLGQHRFAYDATFR